MIKLFPRLFTSLVTITISGVRIDLFFHISRSKELLNEKVLFKLDSKSICFVVPFVINNAISIVLGLTDG